MTGQYSTRNSQEPSQTNKRWLNALGSAIHPSTESQLQSIPKSLARREFAQAACKAQSTASIQGVACGIVDH
ncbi:MAG TPA: hypothetical protein VKG65_08995 [Terriglobales bacterium]|nr:hypothetical protein [Terriglobales bacterium]